MKSLSEHRHAGEGRNQGGRRLGGGLHAGRWRRAEAGGGGNSAARRPRPSAAGKFVRATALCSSGQRRAASANPTGPLVLSSGI